MCFSRSPVYRENEREKMARKISRNVTIAIAIDWRIIDETRPRRRNELIVAIKDRNRSSSIVILR